MMPDFPSATGTLSSWRERKREGGSEAGNRGRGRRGSWRDSQTAGNQFPVTESLLGSEEGWVAGEGEREGRAKSGVSRFVY